MQQVSSSGIRSIKIGKPSKSSNSQIFVLFFFPISSCSKNGTLPWNSRYDFSNEERMGSCKEAVLNKTAIFVSCGVVISLALVFVIVKTIRHVYKPLRPRIKKTYVVHKNVVPTPLTCRPTTEQCEITIENCCNMNICDTVRIPL